VRRTGCALASALMLGTACGGRPTRWTEGHRIPVARPHPRRHRVNHAGALFRSPKVNPSTAGAPARAAWACCWRRAPTPEAPMPTPRRSSIRWSRQRPSAPTTAPAPGRVTHHLTGVARCATCAPSRAKLPLRTPYVLVGQSGVAATSTSAARPGTPERVAGLVTIDSYHDDPEVLRAEGFVWTDNPEFVDYVDYSAVTAVNRCRQPRLAERECCAGRADAFPACAGAVAECRFALLLQCSRGWRAAGAEVV
jgi:hypothetical protein